MLHLTKSGSGFFQRFLALKAIERLQRFEPVFLHTRADTAFKQRVQIDENTGAQKTVDLIFPRGMATHKPLESAWLISREMVDMHRRISFEIADGQIYKPLKRLALFPGAHAPSRHI